MQETGGLPVVGDGEWLTVGEATALLKPLPEKTVRKLIDDGFALVGDVRYPLRSVRPPAVGVGYSHRRVRAADVEKLRGALQTD